MASVVPVQPGAAAPPPTTWPRMHWLTLSFDDVEVERAYRRPRANRWWPFVITAGLGAGSWVLMVPWSAAVVPAFHALVQRIVYGYMLPALALCVLIPRLVPARY